MAVGKIDSLGFNRGVYRDDHDAFRETIRKFIRSEIEPNIRQWEKDGHFPAELFKAAARAGLLAPGIPEDYGGGGGDVLHGVILHEELGYSVAGASLGAGLGTEMIPTYLLYDCGTEQQKRDWLPIFTRGDGIAEVGVTEAGAGSDTWGITTHARPDGDDYIINGQKMWMSNGPILTHLFLVCKTQTKGRDSTTMFILPLDTEGVSRSSPTDLMAKGCGGVCEVFFDDVRVSAQNILGGEEGSGLKHAFSSVTLARVQNAARAVAASELALELTLDYVKNRRAFGQAVYEFQNTQFKLASVATEIAAARAFVDAGLQKMLGDTLDQVEAAKLKLFCSEMEGRVMDECLQLHGGVGFSNEYPISQMYSHARAHRIYLGTSEIMRLIIGRSL